MTNGHKKDYVSEYQTTPKIGGRKKTNWKHKPIEQNSDIHIPHSK